MCWAAQPPQSPNQRQNGAFRSGLAFRSSTSSARRPARRTLALSPGKTPGTVAPLSATPSPCVSSATIVSSSNASAMARRKEEFPRPGAAQNRRGNEADHGPAGGLDACPDVGAGAGQRLIASDPTLDDLRPSDLELRLDEADEPRSPRRELEDMRQNQ